MKIFLMAVTFFAAQLFVHAQAPDTTAATGSQGNCFDEYKAMFAKQGVYELKDGLHTAIITIRLNGVCTTYEGQVRTQTGKFILPIFIKNEDGKLIPLKETGRKLNKNYDAYRIPLENKVVNGCSPTYISDKDELVDIFIIDILKPVAK